MKKGNIRQLQIAAYNYHLPDDRIAKYPLRQRDASKLLVYNGTKIDTFHFNDLPGLLREGSLLLFNNTKVIHARLLFQRETGAKIEIFCLTPHHPADYALNFQQRGHCSWHCLIGNAKRWKDEPLSMPIPVGDSVVRLMAEKTGGSGIDTVVRFSWDNEEFTFSELLEIAGKIPIPPYLNRPSETGDDESYQTVYSRFEGSVAAPTAGLHFTEELMERLRDKGIRTAEVTLHVGAGTFKPVKSETIAGHEMHTEFISVPKQTIEELLHHSGDVIVVGTTSVRTIESLYYIGRKLYANSGISGREPDSELGIGTAGELGNELLGKEMSIKLSSGYGSETNSELRYELGVKQWEPYNDDAVEIDPKQALEALLHYLEATGQEQLITTTQIMIAPGYRFHFSDAIITNFHQPQSTLLLLISAFVGDDWRKIYDYAMQNRYRFLSYGDSSLLWKKTENNPNR